jgi:thiol-disulfide isomerase/thioredoxin
MTLVVAAVVLVGVLALINLVFSIGVIRRLREHTEILSRLEAGSAGVMLEPGQTVTDFAATTLTGEPASLETLNRADGPMLVGFFSPGCGPCEVKLPAFVEYAREHPERQSRVLAVVVGESDEEATPLVSALTGTVDVVRDTNGGPVAQAFDVRGFPAFALVDSSGLVLASGSEISAVSETPVKV